MPLELGHVAERHPGASLILAHAAIVAQAGIGELARNVENIFFDSSTWSPFDLLNLFSLVPPEQLLWASDIPYGEPLAALNLFVRAARKSGAGRRHPARHAVGDAARGLLDGKRPDRRSAPLGDPETRSSYARVRASFYLALGDAVAVDGHAGDRRVPRPRRGRPARGGPRRAGRPRQRPMAALWAEWVTTIVPGAPPDLIGRGRVFRLLNAAQADTVLG